MVPNPHDNHKENICEYTKRKWEENHNVSLHKVNWKESNNGGDEKQRSYKHTENTMAKVSASIINNDFKVNGLSSLIKRHGMPEWMKKSKTQLSAVYNRCTECLRIMVWKWKDGKRYAKKIVTKREQGCYNNIRQNRLLKLLQETKEDINNKGSVHQ